MGHTFFTDLEVYKECRTLRINVSNLVKNHFPPEEKYKLSDQIIRCSRRITACIAEGYGRFHYQENIKIRELFIIPEMSSNGATL